VAETIAIIASVVGSAAGTSYWLGRKLSRLELEVRELRGRVSSVEGELSGLRSRVTGVEGRLERLEERMGAVEAGVAELRERVRGPGGGGR